MVIQVKTQEPTTLASGPGWKLIYKQFDDGSRYPFIEVSQPNGEAVWYTPESIVERIRTWDALIGAL